MPNIVRRAIWILLVCVFLRSNVEQTTAALGEARQGTAAGAPSGRGANITRVSGHSFTDKDGAFLSLGASYFQALRRGKYDRSRLSSDLALLASKGFNYVRVFSMVS